MMKAISQDQVDGVVIKLMLEYREYDASDGLVEVLQAAATSTSGPAASR
jgi:hypothetical protein